MHQAKNPFASVYSFPFLMAMNEFIQGNRLFLRYMMLLNGFYHLLLAA